MSRTAAEEERRRKLTALQQRQRRADRRINMLLFGGTAAVAVLLIGATAAVIVDETGNRREVEAAAARPIDGVEEFADLTNNHVEGVVEYPQMPPVGGDHSAVWANCGAYSEAVDPTQATHSLEHGAVWVGYDPELPQDQVDDLSALTDSNPFLLVSPVEGMTTPVTASAWGVQLGLDDPADPRLATFVQKYQVGEQAPEPGAPCTGGVGVPS